MNTAETAAAITYANQLDPRVQQNDSTLDLWDYSLARFSAEQVRWVIRDYYANHVHAENLPAINPSVIRKRIGDTAERSEAKRNAVKALPRGSADPTASWRDRNPEEWDRLVAKGRDDRRADLQRRGIDMMPWQTEKDRKAQGLDRDVQFQGWGAA